MEETTWIPWIGLPLIHGADPRAGVGACCFRMAGVVRQELGLPWPEERMAAWYDRAEADDWEALRADWKALTEPIESPTPGSITQLDKPDGAFGLGVLVTPTTMLTVIPTAGVVSVPRSVWKNWKWREVKV
jgi:hypothetical protein